MKYILKLKFFPIAFFSILIILLFSCEVKRAEESKNQVVVVDTNSNVAPLAIVYIYDLKNNRYDGYGHEHIDSLLPYGNLKRYAAFLSFAEKFINSHDSTIKIKNDKIPLGPLYAARFLPLDSLILAWESHKFYPEYVPSLGFKSSTTSAKKQLQFMLDLYYNNLPVNELSANLLKKALLVERGREGEEMTLRAVTSSIGDTLHWAVGYQYWDNNGYFFSSVKEGKPEADGSHPALQQLKVYLANKELYPEDRL